MTPREWCLLREGYAEREESRMRQIARWVSPIVSASAGSMITPAQLLGEEEPAESPKQTAAALRKAERKMEGLLRKVAKRKKKEKLKCQE